jgi:hypothetical protein
VGIRNVAHRTDSPVGNQDVLAMVKEGVVGPLIDQALRGDQVCLALVVRGRT